MNKKKDMAKELTLDVVYDIVGSVIYAIGTLVFIAPNNIAPGGASGIAIMLNYLFGLPIGMMSFAVNVPLLILAFIYIGKGFTFKTLRTVVINTVMLDFVISPLIEKYHILDMLGDDERLVGALFGGVFVGAGLAIIFLRDSTTGGTDVAGRLLQLKFPHLQIGRAMMFVDVVIVSISVLVFGSLDSALYALVTIFVTSRVIDSIIYGADKGTMAVIVSSNPREIVAEVFDQLERGVTILKGIGAYSGQDKEVLLCAVRQPQVHKLEKIVYEADPNAFIIVTEANQVLGEGFKDIQKSS